MFLVLPPQARLTAAGIERLELHLAAERCDAPPAITAIRLAADLTTTAPITSVAGVVEPALRYETITRTVARASAFRGPSLHQRHVPGGSRCRLSSRFCWNCSSLVQGAGCGGPCLRWRPSWWDWLRAILALLVGGPHFVCEMAASLGERQNNISNHLAPPPPRRARPNRPPQGDARRSITNTMSRPARPLARDRDPR